MKINEFDVVELMDGRQGTVIDILTHPSVAYMVELSGTEDDDFFDSTPIVKAEHIKAVLYPHEKQEPSHKKHAA